MKSPARGKFPPELIQKIRDTVSILEVVGEHVVLRKAGANFTGLCPFHAERSPSFSVSEAKQLYHCYGCKKGGDLFSFVMEVHAISFPEAVEELADRARVAMPAGWDSADGSNPEQDRRRREAREKLQLAYKLNRFVAAFYHQHLSQSAEIGEYFRKRGVDAENARNFYVGAAPAGWDALAQHLQAKKAPLALAQELGLVRPSQRGQGHFDLFRNRAMFPILDMRGKVVAFGGRSLPGESAQDSPKYMNSPESFLYHKGKVAFGLYQAQKYARERDEILVVEGYFDVLALHAAGFRHAVSTCGTSLTPDHLTLFRKFASRVVILFDGDRAGVTATERAMETGLDHGVVLYGAAMPADLDPDEVLFDAGTGQPLAGGRERMQAILAAAAPLLDARIAAAVEDAAQGPEARTRALKQVASWLGRYADPVGREVRIQDVVKRLGVSRQLLSTAGAGPATAPSRAPARPSAPSAPRPAGAAKLTSLDRLLLKALARGGAAAQRLSDAGGKMPPNVGFEYLFDSVTARAFVMAHAGPGGNPARVPIGPDALESDSVPAEVRSILTEASIAAEDPFTQEELGTALDKAVAHAWARFSQSIKSALAAAEAKKDAQLQSKLMQDYLDVQRRMKEFTTFYDEA
jgi:DNA primase